MLTIQINDNINLDTKRYNYKNCALKIVYCEQSKKSSKACCDAMCTKNCNKLIPCKSIIIINIII